MTPRRGLLLLLVVVAALAADLALPPPVLAASVSLNPSSGDAPSVRGTLSGGGWQCSYGVVPAGSASVTGAGVTGSATVFGRTGDLTGSFTVTGNAGQSREITVRADNACPGIGPPIYIQASATFRFNAPTPTPTATSTPTPAPSPTPTPTAAATPTPTPVAPTSTPTPAPAGQPTSTPTPTPTPPAGVAPPPVSGGGANTATLTIQGCDPDADTVEVEMLSLTLAGAAPMMMPAAPVPGKPGMFSFPTPEVEPGNLFQVTPKINDPDCEPATDDGPGYWLSGKDLEINTLLGGKTQLWIWDSIGDTPDCEKVSSGENVLACWDTSEEGLYGVLSKLSQKFRWQTELTAAKKAVLQVGYAPFPAEADLLEPQWMLAKWDVTCLNCQFSIPLKQLASSEPPQKKSIIEKGFDVVVWPFEQAGKGAKGAYDAVVDLLGLGGGAKKDEAVKLGEPQIAGGGVGAALVDKDFVLPTPLNYYFRLVPLTEGGELAGGPSNTVVLTWTGEKGPGSDIKIYTCPPGQMLIGPETCGTPTPKPKPFIVEVIEYDPLLPPKKSEACFIATGGGVGFYLGNHYHAPTTPSHAQFVGTYNHQYSEGDILCPPDPPESCDWDAPVACLEAGFSALEDALAWVAEAYADAKAFAVNLAVSTLGPFIPDSLCDDSCLKTAVTAGVDTALLAAGIPPSIPNLDQLMNQGIDYLAEQAVAQLPPAAVEAAKLAGKDPKDLVKDAIKQGIVEMQKAYADSVDWLPEGVPVTPDGWKPPKVAVKVTRDGSVPFTCTPDLKLGLTSTVTNDFQDPAIKQQLEGFNASLGKYEPKLVAGDQTQLYLSETVSLPCLEAGESVTIPLVLYKADKWGTPGGYSGSYSKVMTAWWLWWQNGKATFIANVFTKYIYQPLGQGGITTAADKSYP